MDSLCVIIIIFSLLWMCVFVSSKRNNSVGYVRRLGNYIKGITSLFFVTTIHVEFLHSDSFFSRCLFYRRLQHHRCRHSFIHKGVSRILV